MSNTVRKQQRILGLDVAKIFASFMVVLMHTLRNMNPEVPYHPFLYYFTRVSIPIFFICLGYIQLNRTGTPQEYLKKKIVGIVSVSMAWILIYDVIVLFWKQKILFHRDIWGWLFQKGSFSVFWFMATMIVLYLMLPWMQRVFHGQYSRIFFGVLMLFCVMADVVNLVGILVFDRSSFWQEIIPQPYRLWTWMFYFYAGGMIKKAENIIKVIPSILLAVATTIIAVLYEYYMCYIATRVINAEYMYDSFPVIIWSISLFCLFLCVKNENAIIQKVLSNLAGCLIPIYAIHNQILRELKTVEMLKSSSMELLCYFAVIAICVVIGLILSRIPVLNRLTKI